MTTRRDNQAESRFRHELAAERAAKLDAERPQRELLRELLLAGRSFDDAAKVVEQMREWLDARSRGAPS
jgi:hypothetical protein